MTEEVKTWRCFHCDEVFMTYAAARMHFGREQDSKPVCVIKIPGEWEIVRALRNAEDKLARYRNEDSDVIRAMEAMQSEHYAALRREEEKGYERGLRDARAEHAKTP